MPGGVACIPGGCFGPRFADAGKNESKAKSRGKVAEIG